MDPASTRDARRTRPCSRCGHPNLPWAQACHACGAAVEPVRVAAASLRATPRRAPEPQPVTRSAPTPSVAAPRTRRRIALRRHDAAAWRALGLGAFLAPAFGLLPILRYMGWFLASLVHEIGHCVVAWFCGMPAYPAIRIDGHAAAIHRDQSLALAALVMAGLVWLAWRTRAHRAWRVATWGAVVLYPVLAFTQAHEVLHLLAGHLSELVFAGVFFHRALSGGFTTSAAERVTYASCAWYLLARNVLLDFGLVTSADARAAYEGNGSFGLTQDFVRAARELGWSLEGVGGLMLLLSLATLPLTWWLWHRGEARFQELSAR